MAAAVTVSFRHKGVCILKKFEQSKRQLLQFLTSGSEQAILGCSLQRMRQAVLESVPTANELRTYFQSPDERTVLSTYQQMLAMDKPLEYAEISLRTLCDLIRYQQLKRLGAVHSVREFWDLFHTDINENLK